MEKLRNERGMALMMALILTLVSLAVVMAVMYFITESMKVSATSRRYKSALEASYGGVEAFTREIIPWYIDAAAQNTIASRLQLNNSLGSLPPVFAGAAPSFSSYTCMRMKLTQPPSAWGTTACGAAPTSTEATKFPDAVFKLKGPPLQPNYIVYAKIVDTQQGNSDMSGMTGLDSGGGVAYGNSGISPMHIPATYRIETQAQSETNPLERAKLSVLYAY